MSRAHYLLQGDSQLRLSNNSTLPVHLGAILNKVTSKKHKIEQHGTEQTTTGMLIYYKSWKEEREMTDFFFSSTFVVHENAIWDDLNLLI